MYLNELVKLIDEKLGYVGTDDYNQSCYWETSNLSYKERGAHWDKYVDTTSNSYFYLIHEKSGRVNEVHFSIDKATDKVKLLESTLKLN